MQQLLVTELTFDWIGVAIPFLATLCYISLTMLVLVYGRNTRVAKALAIYLAANVAWTSGSLFWHLNGNLFWNRILTSGATLMGLGLVYFVQEFLEIKSRKILYVAAGIMLLLLGLIWSGQVVTASYLRQGVAYMELGPAFPVMMVALAGVYIWNGAHLLQRYRKPIDRRQRYQIQYLLLALTIQLIGGVTNSLPLIGHLPIDIALSAVSAILIAYAILHHQLVDLVVATRHGLGYFFLSIGVIVAYLLSLVFWQGISRAFPQSGTYIFAVLIGIAFAIIHQLFRKLAQPWARQVFFKEQYDNHKMLEEFSRETASILSLEELSNLVLDKVSTAMSPKRAMLLVATAQEENSFRLLAQRGYSDAIDSEFFSDHLSDAGAQNKQVMDKWGIEMLLPVRFEDKLIGILALGPKKSGGSYLSEDEAALRTLANQLAVAMQNASLVEDLRQSIEKLRQVQEQLIQTGKMSAVGQLVAGVAHEINNPLTAIKGFTQLLLEDAHISTDCREKLTQVDIAAERCERIVKNLLLFARKKGAQREMCDINRILHETLSLQTYRFKVDHINLIEDLQSNLPPTFADRYQLQQVFLNILMNAQYVLSETDGGSLSIKTRVVNGMIRISIADTGPGMSEEVKARIFEPFFTTKEVGEGTGLGLSICYGIIRNHGGQITVDSKPGDGATFHIDLPIRHSEQIPQPPQQASSEQRPAAVQPSQRILVVDDEKPITNLVRKVLEREGFTVDVAETGMAALDFLEPQRGHDYELILTDLRMPGLDGYKLYAHLQSERPGLEERIVFMTGDTSSPDTVSFLTQTRRDYLTKPFGVKALKEMIHRTLSVET